MVSDRLRRAVNSDVRLQEELLFSSQMIANTDNRGTTTSRSGIFREKTTILETGQVQNGGVRIQRTFAIKKTKENGISSLLKIDKSYNSHKLKHERRRKMLIATSRNLTLSNSRPR